MPKTSQKAASIQIGARRHAKRPSYVAKDLTELGPVKYRLEEAEQSGVIMRTRRNRIFKPAIAPAAPIISEPTKETVQVSAPAQTQQTPNTIMSTTKTAPAAKKSTQAKGNKAPAVVAAAAPAVVEAPAAPVKRGRGRPTNADLGYGTPVYMAKMQRRATAHNMVLDAFLLMVRENRRVKERNKKLGLTIVAPEPVAHVKPVAAVKGAIPTPVASVAKATRTSAKKAKTTKATLRAKKAQVVAAPVAEKMMSINEALEHFANEGNKEYQKVRTFCQHYNVVLQNAISLLSGLTTDADAKFTNKLTEDFKGGTFKVRALDHAERIVTIRNQVKTVAKDFYRQRNFTAAVEVVASLPGFDDDRMMKKLKTSSFGKLFQAPSVQLYAEQLVGIYNNSLSKGNRLAL